MQRGASIPHWGSNGHLELLEGDSLLTVAAVEYHDPHGVFALISNDIAARLPVRNLIWRSPTRPLRKINSLHLDFVPDNFTRNSLRPAQKTDSDGATSFDIVRSGVDPRKDGVKERRHQIPGLQTSPYLKLYILRADDKDTYKATERKKIREWVRDNAAASKKGKGENHDAFDWMIIHVVIPDTIASSEPRWRESSRDSEELKERKQGMKLPGKSTRTVFDKLRADFNETGKSGQDRVAQIRLTRAQVSADLLPTPAMATTIEETHDEREKAWDHLMGKIKTMILSPFDTRVRQYEADVAEQESRRAMPGFNFCTFFIYKEGLAMAFESIGLVEDALVIYDELSLGFETVLKSISGGQADGTATTFAPFTSDIIDRVVGSKSSKTNGAASEGIPESGNVGAFQKDYRERIVRSDISVFDFSCYLFARQNALILRIANAKSSRFGSRSAQQDEGEDLVLISEVCWRSANFIHNAARSLRQDLYSYRSSQWEKKTETPISDTDVESLVSSWTYIVAGQMLHETYSPALETTSEPGRGQSVQNGIKHPSVANLGGVSAHPQRTTSLPSRKPRASELQNRDSLQSASDSDLMSPPMSPGFEAPRSTGTTPGLIELVTYRAELLMMQRKMLEHVAKQRNWVSGWALMKDKHTADMDDVDLNDDSDTSADVQKSVPNAPPSSLVAQSLKPAMASREAFNALFERLSNQATRLYLTATQSKRAESIIGDLAILKYQQGDFNYAAAYFQHVLPFYTEEAWSLMEVEALRMHSMCLKELDRKEEYVTTLLALAAKACGWRVAQGITSGRAPTFDEVADVAGVLPEALSFSKHLDTELSNPAALYFGDIMLDREVVHNDDGDGFSLRLRLRHLLDDEVQIDHIAARLANVDDPNIEVWLAASDVKLKRGHNEVSLESTSIAFGSFILHGVALQTNNVIFVHEPPKAVEGSSETVDITTTLQAQAPKQPALFLYPNQHAFEAEVTLAKHVQIDKPRHLEIRLSSGWNDVKSIDLKLKPATAGLRLHLADALSNNIDPRPEDDPQGQLSLGALAANAEAQIRVPYSLEQAGQEIFVRMEVGYTTSNGSFTFLTSARPQTRLALDVDVNDDFTIDKLFSNFTFKAASHTPISISSAALGSSARYAVERPPSLPMPMYTSDQQPARLVYTIAKTSDSAERADKSDATLMLDVKYSLVKDTVLHQMRQGLATTLKESRFATFARLLLPFMYERCKLLIAPADAEQAAQQHKVTAPSYEDIGWSEITAGLPDIVRNEIADWLRDWHKTETSISVEPDHVAEELQCSIKIPVEVPSVDFVHSASLDLQQEASRFSKGARILKQGEPVKAQLQVETTTSWRRKSTASGEDAEGNFVYDIHTDPECWLIGGLKRSHFTASNGSRQTFDVLLIPIMTGLHALPHVDVHVAHAAEDTNREQSTDLAPALTCESHYECADQLVQVVSASQTTRVFVPESSAVRPSSRPGSSTTGQDVGG
ncbi:uncharacterized protein LTR77_002965 [Saxophila tyrrhenica]|uniref:Trafficking protein particle complex subunit 10 n=1 Tax=Saxophila tyrrhenica TaxID=1690608 RepID=A0AAV9PKI8_9PEZI|nr:hypothetical protein LTR77_002965 [Saxophila tyrrhenica]